MLGMSSKLYGVSHAYILTDAQPADIFTKSQGQSQLHLLLGKLRICNLHTPP